MTTPVPVSETPSPRPIPQAARDLVASFEGNKLKAYRDLNGVLTIGRGHTGPDVKEGMVITEQESLRLFETDLREAADIVEKHVTVPLRENEFAALISFVFNIGPGKVGKKSGFAQLKNGTSSTLLRALNAGIYDQVPVQLMRWTHDSKGQQINGLTRRRAEECKLWNQP